MGIKLLLCTLLFHQLEIEPSMFIVYVLARPYFVGQTRQYIPCGENNNNRLVISNTELHRLGQVITKYQNYQNTRNTKYKKIEKTLFLNFLILQRDINVYFGQQNMAWPKHKQYY